MWHTPGTKWVLVHLNWVKKRVNKWMNLCWPAGGYRWFEGQKLFVMFIHILSLNSSFYHSQLNVQIFQFFAPERTCSHCEMVLGVQEGTEKLRGMGLSVWVCEQHLELRKGLRYTWGSLVQGTPQVPRAHACRRGREPVDFRGSAGSDSGTVTRQQDTVWFKILFLVHSLKLWLTAPSLDKHTH